MKKELKLSIIDNNFAFHDLAVDTMSDFDEDKGNYEQKLQNEITTDVGPLIMADINLFDISVNSYLLGLIDVTISIESDHQETINAIIDYILNRKDIFCDKWNIVKLIN